MLTPDELAILDPGGPTLIQRQQACIDQLTGSCRIAVICTDGRSAMDNRAVRIKRLHAEAMMRAGYPKEQAWASAKDCHDMARLTALADYHEGKRHGYGPDIRPS